LSQINRYLTPGCFYANETHPDVYLKIGEHGYNGLIKHVCDRFEDYPGRVQYYAEVSCRWNLSSRKLTENMTVFQVRKDVHVKHPTNKGINKNFPEPADLRIKNKHRKYKSVDSGGSLASRERVDVHRKLGDAPRQGPISACVATTVADR
ncbi:hypothetical protein ANCDUO_04081, partial [Ancylostoma duodenale]